MIQIPKIMGKPPHLVLDFGCDAGRDLKLLAALGHTAIGLEKILTGFDFFRSDKWGETH